MIVINTLMTFWNLLVGQVMLYTGLSSTLSAIIVVTLSILSLIALFMTAKWVYKKIKTKLLA